MCARERRERERKKDTDFKGLAHGIVGAGKFEMCMAGWEFR